MTLTIETAIAILVGLGSLVTVYVTLNEKIARQDERHRSLKDTMDKSEVNLNKKIEDTAKWVEELSEKIDTFQEKISTALYQNTIAIERLSSVIENIQRNENIQKK